MFNRMKIYTVHIKPDTANAYEKPVFVREGFSVMAFALTVLWTLYHRLWGASVFIIAINAAAMLFGKIHIVSPESVILLQLAIQLLIGFHAHDWLRANLAKRGYIMSDITASDSLFRAEQRYFERTLAAAH